MRESDVDALVDSLTHEQLIEWQAMALIDGWYHGWAQTAEILAMLNNAANRISASNGTSTDQMKWLSGFDILQQFRKPNKSRGTKPTDRLARLNKQHGH